MAAGVRSEYIFSDPHTLHHGGGPFPCPEAEALPQTSQQREEEEEDFLGAAHFLLHPEFLFADELTTIISAVLYNVPSCLS